MREISIESLTFLSVFRAHRWITEPGQISSVVMRASYFCQK